MARVQENHYMKTVLAYTFGLFFILSISYCSTPREQMPSSQKQKGVVKEVYTFKADAKSFQKELAGTWTVISMRRQQKAELETLNHVTLTFPETGTRFTGKAPCNNIFGTIQLNGYSIRFQGIGATRMTCPDIEKENAYINLLETRISAFTIEGDKLYLRDGISNIVFECRR